ncbi:uncharacterized protein LOC126482148 [Schistocerca serialis cubense]|uniref:uncharacterized protein LOC126482148 n=1 Tax=Schistocerca serialis cubense TaxID=2023355 RepID=UPI00214EA947|nr:uncharacterized protein LOC126482148 [Schistocerca serialis cubense]
MPAPDKTGELCPCKVAWRAVYNPLSVRRASPASSAPATQAALRRAGGVLPNYCCGYTRQCGSSQVGYTFLLVAVCESAGNGGDLAVVTETGGEETTPTAADNPSVDQAWLMEAIRDVAYDLRQHKFSDFDRRYFAKEEGAPRCTNSKGNFNPTSLSAQGFFGSFPTPPLRSFHWEVQQYCGTDFYDCIRYLQEKALQAGLRRQEDTTVLMRLHNWTLADADVAAADAECRRLRDKDWIEAQPFRGPLERFQWRTSASLYLCWHTLRGRAELAALGEACDDWASCLQPDGRGDVRANDTQPFACALYSFCPDPCCPRLKHVSAIEECWQDAEGNPCWEEAPEGSKECSLPFELNTDLDELRLNHWNLSCQCSQPGFVWSSRFGICIDIDECLEGTHECKNVTEACLNLPGTYDCTCAYGYIYSDTEESCIYNSLLNSGLNNEYLNAKVNIASALRGIIMCDYYL